MNSFWREVIDDNGRHAAKQWRVKILLQKPVRPPISRAKVNRHKVQFVLSLRAVLGEMCRANRTPESLLAADEVEERLTSVLGGGQ